MLKRLAIVCLATAVSSVSYAGYFYAGPMALVETVTGPNSNYRGISPRLSLGYDQNLGYEYHLAAELFATPATLQLDENSPTGPTSVKITRSFGASVLPSYFFTETVRGYLRAGIISTKFYGPSSYGTGAQFGLGVQAKLSDCWDIRAEYDYIGYRSISNIGAPTSDFFGVGLLYDLSYLTL